MNTFGHTPRATQKGSEYRVIAQMLSCATGTSFTQGERGMSLPRTADNDQLEGET